MKTVMVTTLVFAMVVGAEVAQASTTTVALYRCGEDDHVNAGDPAGATLAATVGTNATRLYTGGSGTFTSSTAAPGSLLALTLTPTYTYTAEEYLNGRSTNWGMEAWLFLPATLPSQSRAFSNGYWGSGIGIRNGNWVNDVTADVPVAAALKGTWANVAFVFDGAVETWYVNHSPIASATRTATWTNTVYGDLHIGSQNYHNGTWTGGIDEVRIFTFEAGQFNPGTDLGQDNSPAHAELTATPAGGSTLDFGNVPQGTIDTTFSLVTLGNIGDPGSTIQLSGADFSDPRFSIAEGDENASLGQNASVAFAFNFNAVGAALGEHTASVTFNNDSPEGNVTYDLRANVVPIPEPAALGLFGVALLAMRRRRS